MKQTLTIITVIGMIVFAMGCGNQEAPQEVNSNTTEETTSSDPAGQAFVEPAEGETPNILQIAAGSPDHKMLVAAVQAAQIENVLANNGPLTVFAPVDAAFEALPEGTVETLVKPENKEKLAFILKNHVAPANYPTKQLKKEAKKERDLYMASGKYLKVQKKEDGLYVGGTKILKTVQVSNGWIHVIDDVLVPAE